MKVVSTTALCIGITLSAMNTMSGQNQYAPYPAYPPPTKSQSLEADPDFKRLSPEQQQWMRQTTAELDSAIRRNDLAAISRLQLAIAQHRLLGKSACGHTVDEGTYVDADVFNQEHTIEVFAVRWLDPIGASVHSAIFDAQLSCIVADSAVLEDGKTILRVLPNSLAVGNEYYVAYEAIYGEPAPDTPTTSVRRGVFLNERFVYDIYSEHVSTIDKPLTPDTKPDFTWDNATNRIVLAPGVVAYPASPYPQQKPGPTPAATQNAPFAAKQQPQRPAQQQQPSPATSNAQTKPQQQPPNKATQQTPKASQQNGCNNASTSTNTANQKKSHFKLPPSVQARIDQMNGKPACPGNQQ